ncbi:MAG: bifunctional 3,4-dihydroxy-2-butanone-4-phosphate synthase/GTP cyclohydrolase II [Cyanobacteria bacterium P01_F01_bin.33]
MERSPAVDLHFHAVEDAIADLKSGRIIIVVDDENRENEGDLICAAQFATPDAINFMATHGRGLICLAMEGERLDALQVPMMVEQNTDRNQTAFTVSIDAAPHLGATTGISAGDRSCTIQAAINPNTRPEDLVRPGHIFPLRARHGGVLKRAGHTESAIDLARLAGLYPAGVICEIQNPNGSMARLPQLMEYSREHHLKIVTIADLIAYRLQHERFVRREAVTQLPTKFGTFQIYAYRDTLNQSDHVAIIKGDPVQFPASEVLVRVHSECLTGDALGSLRCDCRQQLHSALKMIEHQGQGAVIYLKQEGRGIGLINKLKAYSLQDMGLDTVEANERLGFAPDLRNYGVGAQILNDLGVRRMRLITNNPRKISGLKGFGLQVVDRVPLIVEADDNNARYLATKAEKLGHLLLQTRLLVVALYPKQTDFAWSDREQAEWLERMRALTAPHGLLVQTDPRPIAQAIFTGAGTIVHVGLASDSDSLPWYRGVELDATLMGYRRSLTHILAELAQERQLEGISWMVSSGQNPLDRLHENLIGRNCTPTEFLDWTNLKPFDWSEGIIYHLKVVETVPTAGVAEPIAVSVTP